MKPVEEVVNNENEGIHLEINTENLENQIKQGLSGHQWIQRGPFLVCKSCPIEHGVYIGTDKQLVGLNDDGTPNLRKIT
jgi:hypothetical protein